MPDVTVCIKDMSPILSEIKIKIKQVRPTGSSSWPKVMTAEGVPLPPDWMTARACPAVGGGVVASHDALRLCFSFVYLFLHP